VVEDSAANIKIALKIKLSPGNALITTLTENLPDYSTDEKVYCYMDSSDLVCINVGRLYAANTYKIGIKVNFGNAAAFSATTDFSKISGYIYTTSNS
jgi:hypothetical protein